MENLINLKNLLNKAPRVHLGEIIEECDFRNTEGLYSTDNVRGISNLKSIIPTKADMTGVSLSPYKILPPKAFCYVTVTSRNGGKISLAMNDTEENFIFSSSYITFKVREENKIEPKYLNLILNRSEFDRYSRFNSWGSARETFDWEEMQRVEIPLPSIETQRKLVAVYEGLREMAEQNEALLDPLSEACLTSIVQFKSHYPLVKVGDYITFIKEKNTDLELTLEQGININKEFISPQRTNSDLSSRLKVRKGQLAYCTQLNNENVAIAYRNDSDCVVSPVYRIIEVKDNKLNPEFLFLCLSRKEFGRYVYWASVGSAYEFLLDENLENYRIPLPPIEVQEAIVALYRCAQEAKTIAKEVRLLMKEICPALIQKAANSL